MSSQVGKITANHPEEFEHRALLFWEFFEAGDVPRIFPGSRTSRKARQVVMESCRGLVASLGTPLDKERHRRHVECLLPRPVPRPSQPTCRQCSFKPQCKGKNCEIARQHAHTHTHTHTYALTHLHTYTHLHTLTHLHTSSSSSLPSVSGEATARLSWVWSTERKLHCLHHQPKVWRGRNLR